MLISRRRNIAASQYDHASVHNYYERLVTEAIIKTDSRAASDYDFLADVSCVALNHLPPRYIRHDVDMNFYTSPIELDEINNKVDQAVKHAIEFVKSREVNKPEDEDDTEH